MLARLFFVFYLFLAFVSNSSAVDRIIAVVNQDTITQSEADVYLSIISLQLGQQYKGIELDERMKEEKEQLISKMVEDKIILQEAKRKGYQARLERVKERIAQMKAAFASETDFENSLKQKGLTVKDMEDKVADQMIMREVVEREVRDKIVVSPDEVTKFYEKNKSELFNLTETRTVETLYIENEAMLANLSEAVKNGMDFQEAAKLYKSAYAKDTISKEQIRPELQEGFSGLKALEISDPAKAGNGYYIFKILEILPPKVQGLSEVHDRIYSYFSEEKFAVAMLEWIEGLKEKSYIQIKPE
ncbi:MAG: peptidyl-prolyl cis-trans isomerase [Candidatus Omnitrophota bacterium]|nr:peptidyl-prolyl cis-trans isomerase [Candidatus Omnitrophota bacterium]